MIRSEGSSFLSAMYQAISGIGLPVTHVWNLMSSNSRLSMLSGLRRNLGISLFSEKIKGNLPHFLFIPAGPLKGNQFLFDTK